MCVCGGGACVVHVCVWARLCGCVVVGACFGACEWVRVSFRCMYVCLCCRACVLVWVVVFNKILQDCYRENQL